MNKNRGGCFINTIKLLLWLGLFIAAIIIVEKYQSIPLVSQIRTISKLLSYYIVFLIIPSILYLKNTHFIKTWTISLGLLIFFIAYKWWIALLVLNFAIFNPLYQTFKKSDSELKKEKPNWSFLFLPTIIASIFAFIITKELIWINGLAVLIAWFISSRIQYTYILPVFNLARNYASPKESDIKKDKDYSSFIVLLIAFSLFFLFIKIEKTPTEFISNILSGLLKVSLAIIGLLIALQSLLNRGYNGTNISEKFFEAKLNIASIKAIKGIIILFLLLIIMLIFGYLLKPLFVDFTFPTVTWFNKNEFSLLLLQKVITVIFLSTILGTTLLSLYQLYFLFLSGNLITLPYKIFLNKTSVVFEKEMGYGVDESIKNKIKSSISWSDEFNGEVIKEFSCIPDSETDKIIVTIWFEVLLPDKEDLLDKSFYIARSLFYHMEICKINVLAKSMVSNLRLIKIYSSELDRASYENIEKGMWSKYSIETKTEIIKPFFVNYAFKESDYI
jgi:hypothetical protein